MRCCTLLGHRNPDWRFIIKAGKYWIHGKMVQQRWVFQKTESWNKDFRMTSKRMCLLLYFSTDHPFPSFIFFFLFLKLKCSWMKWVFFWTHQLMKMSLEKMAWFANTEVCKAGFGILKRTSSRHPPHPPPSTILHLPFFLCSGQEMKIILSTEKINFEKHSEILVQPRDGIKTVTAS